MEWIEVTGKTVRAAIEIALDSLGVHESELEFQIVDEPRPGFFGIGRTNARVRARVRPISREKPQDRRRRKRSDQRRSGGKSTPTERNDRSVQAAAGSPATHAGRPESSEDESSGSARSGGGGRSRNRGRKPRSDADSGATMAVADSPAGAESDGPRRNEPRTSKSRSNNQGDAAMADVTISVEEQLSEAQEFTAGLMDAFGLSAQVGGRLEDDDIQIDIEGENLGVLVGPKGATLSAIEELVRTAVLVRAGGFGARIHVDVGGYRRKRREALAGFATKLATEVTASGVAKALEPMSAADRKVVHDTISEIDGVATTSEGEEPRRRVVIRPT